MPGSTLVERLGWPADARLVIFNCDDLGSSRQANLAIVEALDMGVATSATLMVPCPSAREAVDLVKGKDVGVHLTLTAEYPTHRWRSLTGAASLHNDDGYLPLTTEEVWARADLGDVARECRAQIDQALAWGVDVTHLDSHMGANQLEPRFYDLYLDLADEYRLPVRMVGKLPADVLAFPARALAQKRGALHPDEFFFRWGADTARLVEKYLPRLEAGVTEFILHPVLDGPEVRAYDPDFHHVRTGDHAFAISAGGREMLEAAGVHPISFRPLRDLLRRADAGSAGQSSPPSSSGSLGGPGS